MGTNRVLYQNWIVELGRDPAAGAELPALSVPDDAADGAGSGDIELAVRAALGRMPAEERELVECFYFLGMSYRRLSEITGRRRHRLEALHGRAIRRLRGLLADFVAGRFGIHKGSDVTCPICRSPDRVRLDALLNERDPRGTWRPVLKTLQERYGIRIQTPQTLIGHLKYHRSTPQQGEKSNESARQEPRYRS